MDEVKAKMSDKGKETFIKTQYGKGKRFKDFAELYAEFQMTKKLPQSSMFLGFYFDDIEAVLEAMKITRET